MFPKIEIKLSGLDPKRNYFMTLAMRPVDNFKYVLFFNFFTKFKLLKI